MKGRMAVLGAMAAVLTGCSVGRTYPLSVGRTESRLHGMIMPAELGFGPGGSDATVESASERMVTWRLADRGVTIGWLDASLEPVDLDHTRVTTAFRLADLPSGGHEPEQHFINAVGQAVLEEAIDAELADHPYRKSLVQTRVAAYALTHRDEMRTFLASGDYLESQVHDQQVATASARDPNLGVALREADTERQMADASKPSLKLGGDRYGGDD